MSRIGKQPVAVPSNVTATVKGQMVEVKGPKGQLSFACPKEIDVAMADNEITVKPRDDSKRAKQMWGTSRTRVQNLVTGVTDGFTKKLEIQGVGYRAQVQGKTLKLSLGYSHDVDYAIPDGVEVKAAKPTEIEVSGADAQVVGQVAAEIRDWRRPEPYKGKGVRYADEFIFRKEGKKK
ncbi:MAG: 50S ribosomal protein L6 [Rhodobacteraceae bacterium]|nr:50S ribosomal protein L6 [Paracoccaceae bacterium]